MPRCRLFGRYRGESRHRVDCPFSVAIDPYRKSAPGMVRLIVSNAGHPTGAPVWRHRLTPDPSADTFRRSHRVRRGGFLPRRFVHVRFGHADGLRWWLGRGPTQMVVLETHPASGRLVAPGNVELGERTSS